LTAGFADALHQIQQLSQSALVHSANEAVAAPA